MPADTIFALASARGRAGVAVVRVSGPRAHAAAQALCGTLPKPRVAGLRTLRQGDDILDEALVLVFEAGRSFTGEAVVEFHLHGSVGVVGAVLRALNGMEGLRQAEAGEFTLRALQNGRMDLTQVEGLSDLLLAETEAQRRQAQRVLSGAIGATAEAWREKLSRVLVMLEASIDFADEDLPADVLVGVGDLIRSVRADMAREVAGVRAAERIRDGFEVAIVGRPNVGKSTLLNRLAGREAALTSSGAGTTRDVIEVRMEIGGQAVTILDTAGLRDAADAVEEMGVARARERAQAADLRLFLCDARADADSELVRDGDLVVIAKADLLEQAEDAVSGKTGQGVDALLQKLEARLASMSASAGTLTHLRHQGAVLAGVAALDRAVDALSAGAGYEIVSEEVRVALTGIEVLVGRVGVEDILGGIFSTFCIGK